MNEVLTQGSASRHALDSECAAAERRYCLGSPESRKLHARACRRLPGGITRATLFQKPYPLMMVGSDGARLRDADGRDYIDFLGDYTAGVYGHDRAMLRRIFDKIESIGLQLGAPTEYEAKLAELISNRFPSMEQMRFCNSGTEANIFASMTARRFTGRETVLVFEGAYHGGVLVFDGEQPMNIDFPHVRATFNDVESTRALIRARCDDLAAILIEPMMSAGGAIPADPEFLAMLRAESERHGILLIFDEVASSRTAPHGLQGFYRIRPDMTVVGKYLAGGFSFGAFGGRSDIMATLDLRLPEGRAHHGTFNNNVSSMIGGSVALSEFFTVEACRRITARGEALREDLAAMASAAAVPIMMTGIGSVMNVHFGSRPLRSPADLPERGVSEARAAAIGQLRRLLYLHLLEDGIFTAPRGLITVSLAIDEPDIAALKASFARFIASHADLVRGVFDDAG